MDSLGDIQDAEDIEDLGVQHSKKFKLDEEALNEESNSSAQSIKSKKPIETAEPVFQEHLLQRYYEKLFPVESIYNWLRYSNDDNFKNREFSFTLKNDIYLRYRSFNSFEEYKDELGAIYNGPPIDKDRQSQFFPHQRELVFDIDITDYQEIRECCSGAKVCNKCWKLMTAAIKAIEYALKEIFGFKNLLFVFSGRRGIHCWVCDSRARLLSNEARESILNFLNIFKSGESAPDSRILLPGYPLNSYFKTMYAILEPFFENIFIPPEGEDGFKVCPLDLFSNSNYHKVLDIINNDQSDLKDACKDSWDADSTQTSRYRFDQLFGTVAQQLKIAKEAGNVSKERIYGLLLPTIVFYFTYPRIDVNVSTNMNHLLKSPFAVHPKTGKVSVPMNPSTVENFDPDGVPILTNLFREVDESNIKGEEAYFQTSLQSYIEEFRSFVKEIKS